MQISIKLSNLTYRSWWWRWWNKIYNGEKYVWKENKKNVSYLEVVMVEPEVY